MGAGDRNTKLRKHQLADASVDVTDLETTNSASDKQIPSYDSDSGKFKWVDALIALWTGYTEKTTPVDNDIFLINDSASSNVLKKTLWTDIKATLKTYFDGLYKATFAYTAEDVANKSTNVTTDGASDTKYPSVKAVKTYVDNSVIGLLDYRGGYNASGNTYPATGGSGDSGAIMKGDLWIISVAGTLGGVAVQVGDAIVALVDTPGQTSSNWNSLNGNIAYVPEDVANKSTDGTLADNSTIKYPSQSAVKTYADGKLSKSIAGEINALTNKAIPVDADVIVGEDSANSWSKIKIILSNLKSYLKTYFDTLYIAITAPSNGDIIYYNNGTWQRLSIGTIGQTLKINWDAFTKAMLHCDGINGATSFTDEIGKSITNTANYDSYTKLMLHGSASPFVDSIGKTVTNTNVTLDSVNTILGKSSMALAGLGGGLSLASSADWNFAAGDFTVEADIIKSKTNVGIMSTIYSGDFGWMVHVNTSTLYFSYSTDGTNIINGNLGGNVTDNVKHHVSVMRLGNTLYGFVDGIPTGTTIDLTGVTFHTTSHPLIVGNSAHFTGFDFNGNMAEVRISKGIARYPVTGFTPPIAPFGQVYVDTSVKKFGTGSARFLGNGGYLSLANHADFEFGSGDFTIDKWWSTPVQSNDYQSIISKGGTVGSFGYAIFYNGGTQDSMFFEYTTNGTDYTFLQFPWVPAINTLYHLSFVRYGNDFYFRVNGTQVGSTVDMTGKTIFATTAALQIGAMDSIANTTEMNIDELRISKGIARWTSNFTPPVSVYIPLPIWST